MDSLCLTRNSPLLWIVGLFLAVSSRPLKKRGGPDGCEAPLLPLQLPVWAAAGSGPGVGRCCDFCSCHSCPLHGATIGGIAEPQISRRMIVTSCYLPSMPVRTVLSKERGMSRAFLLRETLGRCVHFKRCLETYVLCYCLFNLALHPGCSAPCRKQVHLL